MQPVSKSKKRAYRAEIREGMRQVDDAISVKAAQGEVSARIATTDHTVYKSTVTHAVGSDRSGAPRFQACRHPTHGRGVKLPQGPTGCPRVTPFHEKTPPSKKGGWPRRRLVHHFGAALLRLPRGAIYQRSASFDPARFARTLEAM